MEVPRRPATVVTVDLGGTNIRAALAQGTSLLGRVHAATPAGAGPAAVVTAIGEAVAAARQAAGAAETPIALGIAAPGPLNGAAGIVYSPPNLYGWRDVPLSALLGEQVRLPVHLIKDANAAALAEWRLGAGQGTRTMLYITLSTGIGGGLILDGAPFTGPDGTAGEIGHVTVDRHGPRCNCGNIGCLEAVASGTAIARVAAERIASGAMAAPEGVAQPSAEAVFAAALAGESQAATIVHDAGWAIGLALAGMAHLFNPERIVLGGGLVHGGAALLDPARQALAAHAMPVPGGRVRVVLAALGDDVGLWGAALHARARAEELGQ